MSLTFQQYYVTLRATLFVLPSEVLDHSAFYRPFAGVGSRGGGVRPRTDALLEVADATASKKKTHWDVPPGCCSHRFPRERRAQIYDEEVARSSAETPFQPINAPKWVYKSGA